MNLNDFYFVPNARIDKPLSLANPLPELLCLDVNAAELYMVTVSVYDVVADVSYNTRVNVVPFGTAGTNTNVPDGSTNKTDPATINGTVTVSPSTTENGA